MMLLHQAQVLERHEETTQSKEPDDVATSGTGLERHEESKLSTEPDGVATSGTGLEVDFSSAW